MANLINIDSESGANMIGDDTQPTLTLENQGGGSSLQVVSNGAANATLTGLRLNSSTASVAAIVLTGRAFVSAVSLIFAAGANWAGMGAIRVARSDGTFGWIPVLPDGQVTAAAVA